MTRGVMGAFAALLVALAVALAPGARAQTTPTTAPPATAHLELVDQTPSVEPGGDFVAHVSVVEPTPGTTLLVKVHDRATTRAQLQTTLQGKGLATVLQTQTVPAATVAAGAVTITVGTRVDATGDSSRLLIGPGVYPIEIVRRDATGKTDATITTYLILLRPAAAGPALGVATVVSFDGGAKPATQPDGSTALAPDAASQIAATSAVLAARSNAPVTMVATPERLAAVTDPATRTQLLTLAVGRQVAQAPYVPVDVQAWLGAGMAVDLAAELDVGASTLTGTLGAPSTTAWVSTVAVAPDTATYLVGRGVTNLVVPDDSLSGLDAKRFPRTLTQPFRVEGQPALRAVAADRALTAHLGETGDDALDVSHLLADLAVLDIEAPATPRMVVLELPKSTSAAVLDELLASMLATRTLALGTVDGLMAKVPDAGANGEADGTGNPLVRSLQAPATQSLGTFPSELRNARDDVSSYGSALEPGNDRAGVLDRRALAAGDDELDANAQRDRLAGVRAAVRGELNKIVPPDRQTITFTARDGVVSLTIRNTADYAMNVVLRLVGPRLELPSHPDGRVAIALPAGDTTRVQIDVRARASGDSPLDITLLTPDELLTIARTRVTVRSTAFSGVGIVLSVGSLTFLLLWWGKHTVDARRARSRPRHSAN